ncbi:MAG: PhnD/SsuA/transferrin family substrate-binding protein, partial [Cyanobacteria bacterium P01_F01_bin.116]
MAVMVKRRFFLGYGLLFLGGCTLTQTTESYKPLVYPSKLTFTVINLGDLDALERDFGAFRQALEEVLQVPVNFLAVGDYRAAIDTLLANELDFAMVDPVAYLRLGAGAVPVVGVPRPDHTAMVISRGDSGVNQLSDLKGKTIAMGVDGSTAGHIMPMKM